MPSKFGDSKPKPRHPKRRTTKAAIPPPGSRDRLPPLPPDALTDTQKAAAAELASGPRGGVVGPFIPALRSPELMTRLQRLGHYLRYQNSLGQRLTELAILLVAREWSQPFEWVMHVESAAAHGIARRTIDAIARGRRPVRLARDEAIVYDFLRKLSRQRAVDDRTYARAVAAFGEAGVVDLIGVAGYYATLAMILNVARTPVPSEKASLLPPFAPAHSRARRARNRRPA